MASRSSIRVFSCAFAITTALLCPVVGSAGAKTPRSDNETTLSVPPPADGPAETSILTRARRAAASIPRPPIVPLAAGPLGRNGTIGLPESQSETTVAASGTQVVVGFNDFRGSDGSSLSGVIYSADGGETFSDGGQLPAGGGRVSGDPVLTVYEPMVGPPVFYYSSIFSTAGGAASICIHRSTNGGATWAGPFEVTSATSMTTFQDKEWCTVDPETGRLFVSWTQLPNVGFPSIMVTYSDDGGGSWSPAATVGPAASGQQASVIACDPNGPNVYMAWRASAGGGLRAIRVTRSTNNGVGWAASANLTPSFNEVLPAYGFDRFNGFPSLAVNPSGGGVELVYGASVDGTPASDFGDIFHRRSTDGGMSFSAPVALNAFPGSDRPQIFPTVSAAANGRIDVFWYDQSVGSGVSDLTDMFYTFSSNFGGSWSSPVPVTASPFHNEVGNNYGAPHQGDYIDAVSGGSARAAFAWFGEPSPLGTSADAMASTITSPVEKAALRVRPGTIVVNDAGCAASDGRLVAGEVAQLTLPLQNFGRIALSGITGTLTALIPDIMIGTGTRSYPSLAPGASAASTGTYSIKLSDSYPCGTPARFRLDIAASGVGPNYIEFSLPTGVVMSQTTVFSENFDGVTAPALPAGWSNVNGCGSCPANNWVTTTSTPASPPNAAFCVDNASAATFGRLFGPTVAIPPGTDLVEVTFSLQYDLEEFDARTAFDAASFGYFLDGGGVTRFITSDAIEFDERYPHYVIRASGGGFGDRSGWSGLSSGYRAVRIVIPGLGGHTFQPRFDLTTDSFDGNVGVWVDNFVIKAQDLGCTPCSPVAVDETPLAFSFQLAGANPFQRGTTLRYSIAEPGRVRIEVFSVTGQRVRTLVDRMMEPGTHTARFDLETDGRPALAAGVYLARITVGGESRTLRVVALE